MNKYEIYTPQEDLFDYIQESHITNKHLFKEQDFLYVYPDRGYSFFDRREFINGYVAYNLPEDLNGFQEVSPEEFLIAIGYLPQKPKVSSSKVSPIKAEDIHYICEVNGSDHLCVDVVKGEDSAYVKMGRGFYTYESVKLSPESLIELGSDLVRLGVALRDGTYEH